jgi:hypothetical protein
MENNIMVSFSLMHSFYNEIKAKISATFCSCITIDQTLSLHFVSGVVLFLWILFL